MATIKMLEFITGLVIVAIVFIFLSFFVGGCVSNYLNPKCDLVAVDEYDKFVELYEKCGNVDEQEACKCGDYYFGELPSNHEIEVGNYGDEMRISLFCNGRRFESEPYEKNIGIYPGGDFESVRLDNNYKGKLSDYQMGIATLPNPSVILVNHNGQVKFLLKQPMNTVDNNCPEPKENNIK